MQVRGLKGTGHITPLELRKNLTEIDSTNGFANRILWFLVYAADEVAPRQTEKEDR
jgi:hypothetical protein